MAVTSVSSDAQRPWDIASFTLATTNTWEAFQVPSWVRRVKIKNTHASGVLRLAAQGTADATAAPGAILNYPIAAGGELDLNISGGQARALSDVLRRIVFHSTTASQTFAVELEASER